MPKPWIGNKWEEKFVELYEYIYEMFLTLV